MTPWAHDPPRAWPGVLDQVPLDFADALQESAFDMASTTFCIWRGAQDDAWQRGKIDFLEGKADPDGSADLLWMLDGNPQTYAQFCSDYYEREVPVEAVAAIYARAPLTREIAGRLNPAAPWADVQAEAEKLGYLVA